ncbi:MAG: kinase-like domain-containing protein [Monoraphidium minutum]|nr:MAG: kinase-like domain-containing protein [Monoraphidium minutum]
MGTCASLPMTADPRGGEPACRATETAGAHSLHPHEPENGTVTEEQMLADTLEHVMQVDALRQRLALAAGSSSPLLVYGFCKDPCCAVLLAAAGGAADALPRAVPGLGAPRRAGTPPRALGASAFIAEDVRDLGAGGVQGLRELAEATGMCGFAQAVIGPAAAPLGVLVAANRAPRAFAGGWFELWMGAACSSLLRYVCHAQVERAAALLAAAHGAEAPLMAMEQLLRGARRFVRAATNTRVSVRLALLEDSGAGTAAAINALVVELPHAPSAAAAAAAAVAAADAAGGEGGGTAPGGAPPVVVTKMGLDHTLLAPALRKGKARLVSPIVARDLFSRASGAVSSIVVLPLLDGRGAPLGGVYFAAAEPRAFDGMEELLTGLVHVIAQSIDCSARAFAEAAAFEATRRFQCDASVQSLTSADCQHSGRTLSSLGRSSLPMSGGSGHGGSAAGSSRRLNTDAMMQLMQQEVRRSWRQRQDATGGGAAGAAAGAATGAAAELVLEAPVGRGGFGGVYKGRWHKVPAAVKVLATGGGDARAALQGATEMAVLSMARHPNIVQLYAALTDMVQVSGGADGQSSGLLPALSNVSRTESGGSADSCADTPRAAAAAAAAGAPAGTGGAAGHSGSLGGGLAARYRRLRPDEDEGEQAAHSLVVLEYCDRGTLRDAVAKGTFHRRMRDGGLGVDIGSLLSVLLEVASALAYLHSSQIAHGGVSAESVLLKSDAARRLGFSPKIADFGAARILSDDAPPPSAAPRPANPYLAPEALEGGAATPAADVYAFGMLLWECFTGKRAFNGAAAAVIAELVAGGVRPAFPRGAPDALAALAGACWSADPSERPTMAEAVARLEEIAGGARRAQRS